MPVRLHVWGEHACFTRPEMKVERVSYDVMTPSAARGILEAIHWKPAIRWQIERIHVLKPIRFQPIRRNEIESKASASLATSAMKRQHTGSLGIIADDDRQQRAALVLTDVAYVIEARFELTARAGSMDTPAKHIAMFSRRAAQGQCYYRPYLGTREFAAEFALIPEGGALPQCELGRDQLDIDLGWMLHDIDFAKGNESRFFRAHIRAGVIEVPPFWRR